jgi:GNAT superfamily N-acetyltransferase
MTPNIHLRPAEPERDFKQLAEWFCGLEDEQSTAAGLQDYYAKQQARIFPAVAEAETGERVGFYWLTREVATPEWAVFYLFVRPEWRRQGVGRQLYAALLEAAAAAGITRLQVNIWDDFPEGRAFAERSGFYERRHTFGMELSLERFDDRPYMTLIARLEGEGFRFTSMAELGNTEAAQRKLYHLNDTAASTTPGTNGEHPWSSFEDFQQRVCQSEWYLPEGQKVAIDTANGAWAAMSAITRVKGNDYAYNLFTGVDLAYRGRKLGQAVKVTALRYARAALQVQTVRTHHNTLNLPMIAIDRKLGYIPLRGMYLMEKANIAAKTGG